MDVGHAVAVFAVLNEEEEEEQERMLMLLARVAVEEVMEVEEGCDMGGLDESWVYVTVFIDEYHTMNDTVFKKHFRMSRGVFENLVQTVGNHLVSKQRLRREKTPLQDILLMVVWLMATPDSFRSVALRFGKSPSTLWYFYSYIVEALRELAATFIKWPTAEEREVIKNAFENATGFPGVIGCIDGTHVYITAPVEDAAYYINRHHSYSINVQCVVDHTLLVREIHAGEVGSMNDKRVFRRSPLCHDLLTGNFINADEHLLGDGGYILTDFMLIPFPNNGHLTPQQIIFNRALSQNRVRVENAFARAKGKWRRIKHLHARNPAIVTDHIISSFVLHNFCLLNGEQMWEGEDLAQPLHPNQILDNGVFEEEEEDVGNGQVLDEQLMDAAEVRGIEKRIFIMDHVLPNIQ